MVSTSKVSLNERGYTLIELLFTIGILLIIAVPISSTFLVAHQNNSESKLLEQAMLLGQKVLENKMSDGTIEMEASENLLLNPPVTQVSPFEGFKVQTIVTPISQGINVEKDGAGNDKVEPSIPVEVIEGITGKRRLYQLPLDSGVGLNQVDSSVKPIGSAVEDYQFSQEKLELRSTEHPEGMDDIFYLETLNIRRSTETLGVAGEDITLSFEPLGEIPTAYKLTLQYGNFPTQREVPIFLNLLGVGEANKKIRLAFVVENEETLRQIKLVNKPAFPTEIYAVRGVKDATKDIYYSGTDSHEKPLLSLTYGTDNGSGSYLDNDPKLASDLIQVRANFKSKNEALVRTARLYEVRVLVFKEVDDASTAKPIVELRTYRRAIL